MKENFCFFTHDDFAFSVDTSAQRVYARAFGFRYDDDADCVLAVPFYSFNSISAHTSGILIIFILYIASSLV